MWCGVVWCGVAWYVYFRWTVGLFGEGNSLASNEAIGSSVSIFYPCNTGRGCCCTTVSVAAAQTAFIPSLQPQVSSGAGLHQAAVHMERRRGGQGTLSQSPRTKFIRTHPLLPWRLQAHRACLIVPEFTQASSTIRQDEFLS